MSQNLPIWENYLVVFVCPGICPRIYYGIFPEIYLVKKCLKNIGLLKFASGPPLGIRPDENSGGPWNLIHSPPCRIPCRLFIHEVFFGPLGLHLRVWSELGRSPPFRPMRALRLQWSWAFSLVCELWSGPTFRWKWADFSSDKHSNLIHCWPVRINVCWWMNLRHVFLSMRVEELWLDATNGCILVSNEP